MTNKTKDYDKRVRTFKRRNLIKKLNEINKICPICHIEVKVGVDICPSCYFLFGNRKTETHIYSNQLTRCG